MKKILFFMAALLAALQSASGQFVLKPGGMEVAGSRDSYYAIECPGASREELFRTLAFFLESTFPPSQAAFNAVEPEAFTMNCYAPGAVRLKGDRSRIVLDMDYGIMFGIEPGVVKVFAPTIRSLRFFRGEEPLEDEPFHGPRGHWENVFVSPKYMPLGGPLYQPQAKTIYSRSGCLCERKAKKSVERYFDTLVGELEECLRGTVR